MNLHGMALGAVAVVNPMIVATLRRSTGYTTGTDGTRTPNFTDTTASIQAQELSSEQLSYLDNQGIQGVLKSIYLAGDWRGIVRADQKGGDMMIFGGHNWLIVHVLESWPDWSKVVVCQQL